MYELPNIVIEARIWCVRVLPRRMHAGGFYCTTSTLHSASLQVQSLIMGEQHLPQQGEPAEQLKTALAALSVESGTSESAAFGSRYIFKQPAIVVNGGYVTLPYRNCDSSVRQQHMQLCIWLDLPTTSYLIAC